MESKPVFSLALSPTTLPHRTHKGWATCGTNQSGKGQDQHRHAGSMSPTFAKNRKGGQPRGTVSRHEDTMSKHDTATKRHRRPKSAKRVDYTARTMAALKELEKAAKLRMKPA
jgi:hypothetical protein